MAASSGYRVIRQHSVVGRAVQPERIIIGSPESVPGHSVATDAYQYNRDILIDNAGAEDAAACAVRHAQLFSDRSGYRWSVSEGAWVGDCYDESEEMTAAIHSALSQSGQCRIERTN